MHEYGAPPSPGTWAVFLWMVIGLPLGVYIGWFAQPEYYWLKAKLKRLFKRP